MNYLEKLSQEGGSFFMLKNKIKIIFIFLVLSSVLFLLTGCSKAEDDLIHDKIKEELYFIENNLYSIVSKFAKGEYDENILNDEMLQNITENIGKSFQIRVINFDEVKKDIAKINTSLDVTIIDLSEKVKDTNTILELSNNINNLIIDVGGENIDQILRDINNLEKSIIKNYDVILEGDMQNKKLKVLKSNVLECFVLSVTEENKDLSKEKINSIIDNFSNDIKDKGFVEDNSYLVNNIYILLEEFKTAIDSGNEDLIKLKYISLIEML